MKRNVFKNKKALIQASIHKGCKVLDVGFLGQGIQKGNTSWPHALIKEITDDVYGVDLGVDAATFPAGRYQSASAEVFSFSGTTFDTIFAGDLIEHLPNPGLFLASASRHMQPESRLILTTPNCFNLFNLTEKLMKDEPTVNHDHTCYFNHKTLRKLLEKCGFAVESIGYVYSLEYDHPESWKKKLLNILYRILSFFTPKYLETLVMVTSFPGGKA